MDLLGTLHDELKDRHFSEEEKMLYIYLRTCQEFSFDDRFFHLDFYKPGLKQELESKEFDPHHIDSRLTICHPHIRLLKNLVDELTLLSTRIQGTKHSQLISGKWVMDATMGDFTRIKMNLSIHGFIHIDGKGDIVKELCEEVGYCPKTKHEYLKEIDLSTITSIYESVRQMLEKSHCQEEFADAVYFIHYLFLAINFYSANEEVFKDENDFLARLLKTNDTTYDLKKDKVYQLTRKN